MAKLFWILCAVFSTINAPVMAQEEGEHQDHETGELQLKPEQLARLQLGEVQVRLGSLTKSLHIPGELQFDPRLVAHLVPRVPGLVRNVSKTLGDRVKKGDVLAVLESRALSEAKSKYLAAVARQELAESTFLREQRLWEKRISAEQDYLEAKQHFEESRINTRQERLALRALGLGEEDIASLAEQDDGDLNLYRMVMPFDGTIIEQHLSTGEWVMGENAVFRVANNHRMWFLANIPERELSQISLGQKAIITLKSLPRRPIETTVDYLSPQLDPETRSASARFVLDNPDGNLRAGMFGKATIFVPGKQPTATNFLVPQTAIQRDEKNHVVFKILGPGHYRMLPVTVIGQSDDFAEIQGELHEGEKLATGDLFLLKSQLDKGEMGHGHSH